MSRAKGYHSYRGRVSKLKVLLAVVLCLVILVSLSALYLLEHMVYDENGVRRLEIPWLQEEPAGAAADPQTPPGETEPPELDLVIEGPKGPAAIHACSLPAAPLTQESWQMAWMGAQLSSAVPYDAVAVTLKDSTGRIYFDSTAAPPSAVETEEDTGLALAALTGGESPGYTVARLSCLLDPPTARAKVEDLGLKNTGGYIFYDERNHNWLDPAKQLTRDYLAALVLETADLGFDEVILTDLSYPTAGKLNKIAYTGSEDLSENIAGLVQAIRTALGDREILVSVELPEAVAGGTPDPVAGQDLAKLAPLADRVYAVTTAGQAEALREKVLALNETGDFVPELALESQGVGTDRCLILPQAEP